MTKFKIGDQVKSPNNYEGVVFDVTWENGAEYVYYAETRNNWVMSEGHQGQIHRELARCLSYLVKPRHYQSPPCHCGELEERIDRLLQHLRLEEVTQPETTVIRRIGR